MQDSLRKSTITLPLFGPLAVAAAVATFAIKRPMVLTGAQIGLTDSGTGAGNSSALIKVNGTAVASATSVAGAAASPRQDAALINTVPSPYPPGVSLKPGDVVTVDITAVPATTAPKGGAVYLDVVQHDV